MICIDDKVYVVLIINNIADCGCNAYACDCDDSDSESVVVWDLMFPHCNFDLGDMPLLEVNQYFRQTLEGCGSKYLQNRLYSFVSQKCAVFSL